MPYKVFVLVDPKRRCQSFILSSVKFYISWKWVRLEPDSVIEAQCELLHSIHPHRFASKCIEADPANRLGIYVKGVDRTGNAFSGWLSSRGDMAPMQINTLIDLLEGVSSEESMKRSRRWVSHPTPGSSRAAANVSGRRRYYTE
jgi:hypothetical protein